MFTGIVTAVGTVVAVERNGAKMALEIVAPFEDVALGESIAVNGACLTVVSRRGGSFVVETIATTRERTRFTDAKAGDRVNLERALAVGDRLGGHFVQGHVDGVGTVEQVIPQADTVLLNVSVPPDVGDVTTLHGSITLDGVSLTVNALPEPSVVQVALIPFTREHTTLGTLEPGAPVHVEGDMLGKMVRQLLHGRHDQASGGNGK